ncbi:hypothetical protein TSAR_011106 [Trichomalopsis sarcophagae]|uniref:Uncharacterized protein n=1 Tax=Trichomalopsis sarcophagae TaxID=543379 RepID=A0A232EGF2_9HYME|nr:hypothetical protein TSAR_011106 [Trichomalopsis sarcophagae]
MEHARKMIILPEKTYDPVMKNQQQPQQHQPDESSNGLEQPNKREKCQKYLQILRRYLHFKTLERQELLFDGNTAVAAAVEIENENTLNPLSDEVILTSIPKDYVRKARLLLKHWQSTVPYRIKWDNSGTVSIDGTILHQSNIIDLVEDTVQSKATDEEPTGRFQLANFIASSNFQHFNVNYLSLYVDGVQIPSKPLQPRFTGRRDGGGRKRNNSAFYIVNVATLGLKNRAIGHWIVKALHNFTELSIGIKRSNEYISNQFHGVR